MPTLLTHVSLLGSRSMFLAREFASMAVKADFPAHILETLWEAELPPSGRRCFPEMEEQLGPSPTTHSLTTLPAQKFTRRLFMKSTAHAKSNCTEGGPGVRKLGCTHMHRHMHTHAPVCLSLLLPYPKGSVLCLVPSDEPGSQISHYSPQGAGSWGWDRQGGPISFHLALKSLLIFLARPDLIAQCEGSCSLGDTHFPQECLAFP